MRSMLAALVLLTLTSLAFSHPQPIPNQKEQIRGKEWKAIELIKMQTVRDEEKFYMSPDGKTVAITTAKGVRLYDLDKNSERAFLPELKMTDRCLAYSPDSKWIAVCGSETTVWDVSTGKKKASIASKADALAFHRDKNLLALVDQTTVREWEFETVAKPTEYQLPVHKGGDLATKYIGCHAGYLSVAGWIVSRIYLVQAGGKPVCEYDLIDVRQKKVVLTGTHAYPFLYFPQDGKSIVRMTEKVGLARFNWETMNEVQDLKGLGYNHISGWSPNAFASSKNGDTLATFNTDNQIHIWRRATPKQFDFAHAPNNIMTIGLTPMGDVLQVIMYRDNFFHLQRWRGPREID